MGQPRSRTTIIVLGMLSTNPITVRDIVQKLDCTIQTVNNAAHTLLSSGEAQEVQVMGEFGKPVRGFVKPKPKRDLRVERGEYKGEPMPLRYVQRSEPYISLGGIGD